MKRETIGDTPTVGLDGLYGSFDDFDVVIGSDGVERDGSDIILDASEFTIGLQLGDLEATAFIDLLNVTETVEKSAFVAIWKLSGGAESFFVRDGVEEGDALDVEDIDT